jgi:2-hydroxychromene-2-carboxylate isomerase
MPLKLRPKWYPLAPGLIEIPAQAIIRAQHRYGSGAKIVRDFSFAIQQTLWAREGHIGSPSVLVNCAVEVGIPRDVALLICQDKREDDNDPAVKEWKGNLEEAEALGIFGTPNYVINGEIFWGQDRFVTISSIPTANRF